MITPVNGHVIIEPIKHEAFMASSNETYQEIGIIVAANDDCDYDPDGLSGWTPEVGEKVYFDAWLAAKYPKDGGGPDDFLWLVNWKDVRAAEQAPEDGTFDDTVAP